MRVCAVELKGGEAILCLLSYQGETFNVPDCRQQSFSVSNSANAESIKDFHFAFSKLMQDYHVDQIVVLERDQKGKRAGSATSFKLEAAIQLSGLPVTLMSELDVKEQLKRNPQQVDFEGIGLKKFQRNAFDLAYAFQNTLIYAKD